MYRLYGIPTQNTLKAVYVLDAVGVDYEFQLINLANGEQKTEAFLKINPVGKVPALKHNDFSIFESNSICRYIASAENSTLYPQDIFKRSITDQWLDFFSNHLGRWLSTLFFEKSLKQKLGFGEANISKCEEALNFVNQQIVPVEKLLAENKFFGGAQPSIADYVAYANLEQTGSIGYDLSPYPHIKSWLTVMDQMDSIKTTKTKVKF
jgi:glutathione S-transferase